MSLIDAVNLIQSEIEPEVISAFREFIDSNPTAIEFSIRGLSIFQREPDEIEGLIETLEARLEGSEGYPIAKWVQSELDLIKEARNCKELDIWGAYSIKRTGTLEFAINAQRGEYITCFFPKDWDNMSKHGALDIARHYSNDDHLNTKS